MSMIQLKEIVYDDGRTKESYKDSTDINKILKKAQVTGSIAHLMKYPEAVYGEFAGDCDLLTAQTRILKANTIFNDLPSEIRNEFDNDPLRFVTFCSDDENNERLAEIFPRLAEPGEYFPNPIERGALGAGIATPEVIEDEVVVPEPSPPEAPVVD